MNQVAWAKLPDRLQHIVANTLNGAAQRQREDSANMEESIRSRLTKTGMKFTDIDLESFRDQLRRQGYYARIKSKFGEQTWAVIQKATGVTA
jgi:TRAP-type C4-dicarboxylate transport system substrate-binding protein